MVVRQAIFSGPSLILRSPDRAFRRCRRAVPAAEALSVQVPARPAIHGSA